MDRRHQSLQLLEAVLDRLHQIDPGVQEEREAGQPAAGAVREAQLDGQSVSDRFIGV